MAFCKNCGAQLEESMKFCPSCGTAQAHEEKKNIITEEAPFSEDTADREVEIPAAEFTSAPEHKRASGSLNIGMLVWSIINIICCCSTPLGIVALVFTVIAQDSHTAAEEEKRLKTAKICNILGIVCGAIMVILYMIFIVAMTIIGSSAGGGVIA